MTIQAGTNIRKARSHWQRRPRICGAIISKFRQGSRHPRGHIMITTTGRMLLIASALAGLSSTSTVANQKQTAEVLSTVHSFHAALTRGDAQAALMLLAQDAVILESGSAQSREEYAREHIAEDIAFAKGFRRRAQMRVSITRATSPGQLQPRKRAAILTAVLSTAQESS